MYIGALDGGGGGAQCHMSNARKGQVALSILGVRGHYIVSTIYTGFILVPQYVGCVKNNSMYMV